MLTGQSNGYLWISILNGYLLGKLGLDTLFDISENRLMAEEYISLKEATKYCSYSADYLKLRARQGKLKAIKMGRNWVTTKEWVEEYKKKNYKLQITDYKQISTPPSRQISVGERIGERQNSKPRLPLKRELVLFLIIFLIIAEVFLLLSFTEPVLEKIIPAKVIEIER